jgi:hypothetical protein
VQYHIIISSFCINTNVSCVHPLSNTRNCNPSDCICKSTASNGKRPFLWWKANKYQQIHNILSTTDHMQLTFTTCLRIFLLYFSFIFESCCCSFVLLEVATCCCSFMLHVATNLIRIVLVSRQPVLGSTHPNFLYFFSGKETCTFLFFWKMYLD